MVAIFLISMLVVVFSTSFNSITLNRTIRAKAQAQFLAQEEIETIRTLPFANLTNRTNAPFIGVNYNLGTSLVKADAAALSSPNVYELLPAASATNNFTSLAILPGDIYGDFTFETSLKVLSSSPVGWQAGFAFRSNDINNLYRLVFSASQIKLEKMISGATTSLYSNSRTFTANTWYKLKITATGTSLGVYLDDTLLTTVTDTSLAKGAIALAGLNSAKADFDSLTLTSGTTSTFNFDSLTAGKTASGWERFGLYDLSSGTGKLSIENYNGNADIKKVTVEIDWLFGASTKTINFVTYISNYGLNLQ